MNGDHIVETILQDNRLSRIFDKLRELTRQSIRIRATLSDENVLTFGESKIGGLPDLPPGVDWPTGKLNVPMPSRRFVETHPYENFLPADGNFFLPFVAQLRLADLHSTKGHLPYFLPASSILPTSGILYFFFNELSYASDTGPGPSHISDGDGFSWRLYGYDDPVMWRVFHYDGDLSRLSRTPFPEFLPEKVRYRTCALTFETELTLPHYETCYIGDQGSSRGKLVLTEDEWEIYAELLYDMRANQQIHQMLGHSDDVQPYAMDGGYLGIRSAFFPELPPKDATTQEQFQVEFEQGRLLLQVDEQENGMHFGRGGRLYFFIREQDLRARHFRRVWTRVQWYR